MKPNLYLLPALLVAPLVTVYLLARLYRVRNQLSLIRDALTDMKAGNLNRRVLARESDLIASPENRVYAKVKIFDFRVFYLKNDPGKVAGSAWIDIGKITKQSRIDDIKKAPFLGSRYCFQHSDLKTELF